MKKKTLSLDDKYNFYIKSIKPLQKHQGKTKILYLSLWLLRILLGINLGLGSNNFHLGDHIPNGKGILGGVGISFILLILLSFLLFFFPAPSLCQPLWVVRYLEKIFVLGEVHYEEEEEWWLVEEEELGFL